MKKTAKKKAERWLSYKVEGMQAHRSCLKREIEEVGGSIECGEYTNGSTTFAYLVAMTKTMAAKLEDMGWTVEEWID